MGQTAAPPQHKAGTNRLDPAACTIDNRLDLTLALSSRHYRMARPSLCPWVWPRLLSQRGHYTLSAHLPVQLGVKCGLCSALRCITRMYQRLKVPNGAAYHDPSRPR